MNLARQQAKEEWIKSTTAGKVFSSILLCTVVIALAVMFTSLATLSKPFTQNPISMLSALASAIIQYASLGLMATYMVNLKNKIDPLEYKKIDDRVSYAYSAFLLFFWLLTSVIGLTAHPSCNPSSDWWNSFAAIHEDGPREFSMVTVCRLSLVVISLSITNAVLISGVMMAALVFRTEKSETAPLGVIILRRILHRKTSPNSSGQEVEGLLDRLDV
ncbi:hypothetical protein CALVIDRAFT_539818 [Calocera viscosa TUFC12733]|uniref:Uncharacterized protein n=1 Tax=Calocera viscosa (strain TUFC12733) TaxID=1330018 RepID=A0A167JIZ0_CALVF|nr:hypothetical protein CALVIDRAFT_539818 [Calocera viscosa TUFC12733]